MARTTFTSTSVHLGSNARPNVGYSDPAPTRPNGLAHVHLDGNTSDTVIVGDPAVALRLADAFRDAAMVLRRNELAAQRTAAAAPGVYTPEQVSA